MIFEFKIYIKDKVLDNNYYKRRYAIDAQFNPITSIQSHIIEIGKEQVKCSLITLYNGIKKIAVDQYPTFKKNYVEFLNDNLDKTIPSAN